MNNVNNQNLYQQAQPDAPKPYKSRRGGARPTFPGDQRYVDHGRAQNNALTNMCRPSCGLHGGLSAMPPSVWLARGPFSDAAQRVACMGALIMLPSVWLAWGAYGVSAM